jgi:predicted dehydrogenase
MKKDSKTLSRRTFLQASAGVAAGSALFSQVLSEMAAAAEATPTPAAVKYDERPFKIGFIGAGPKAQKMMAESKKIPGTQVTAITDADAAAVKAAQAIAGPQAKAFADYTELLKSGDCQAVVIMLAPEQGGAVALDALKAGKDVFADRPMGKSVEESKAILKAVVEGQKVYQVAYLLRYHPSFHLMRKFIDKNEIGKVTNVTCILYRKNGQAPAMTDAPSDVLDVAKWAAGDVNPTSVTSEGAPEAFKLTYDFAGTPVVFETKSDPAFEPKGWEEAVIVQGERGRLVMAPGAPHAGLLIMKEGEKDELWMNLATKADVTGPMIVPAGSKKPIVLGKPTPASIFVAGQDAAALLDAKTSQPTKTSEELAILDFKVSCLNRTQPSANALVGLFSTILALKGAEALAKKGKVEIPAAVFALE